MPPPASSPPARRAAAVLTAALALLGLGCSTGLGASAYAGPAPAPATAPATVWAPAARAAPADPLRVEIAGVKPAVIPASGSLTVTGSVTNRSDEQWRVIKVYPLVSTTPLTTPEQLTEAAATERVSYLGDRITTEGVYDTIEVLDPEESAVFTVTVRRNQLPVGGEPGVYWLGIHALGETDAGREEVPTADGRDRVFVPLLDPVPARRAARRPPAPTLDTALVVPLRHEVAYAEDGRLDDVEAWTEALAPGGSLNRLAGLAAAAGGQPLTWLVDPAVTDAAARLADGNPPRSVADLEPRGEGGGEDPGDAEGGEVEPGAGGASARTAGTPPGAWLSRLGAALGGDQLLALPYGDLDIAAAADTRPSLYTVARKRSGGRIDALGLPATAAIAPPGGLIDVAGLGLARPTTMTLVSDELFDDDTRARAPGVVRVLGQRVYVGSSSVLAGSGRRQRSFLDIQQRLLAESLVRLLDKRGPLVVVVPTETAAQETATEAAPKVGPDEAAAGSMAWDTADATRLFAAVRAAPWVRLTTLDGLSERRALPVSSDRLRYPARVEEGELGSDPLGAATQLIARGQLLDSILPRNDTVTRQFKREALTAVSYADRAAPVEAQLTADKARAWIDGRLALITIEAPPSVTLSSATGRLTADVVNGLDQTVRISVDVATDPGLEIGSLAPNPIEELGPGERATVRMEARATTLSVHAVSLILANDAGRPIGQAASFPLRANRVSQLIWVVIGVGGLLLFTTIGLRLAGRIRRGLAARRTRAASDLDPDLTHPGESSRQEAPHP